MELGRARARFMAGGDNMLTFTYRGQKYDYFDHPYNHTRQNERAVEVSIAWSEILPYRGFEHRVLEVGAVLPHYLDWQPEHRHSVIDLRETLDGVINVDMLAWEPGQTFDLIICISTLEHLGGQAQAEQAVERMAQWLTPKGQMLITLPHWFNATWVTPEWIGSMGLAATRFDKTDPVKHIWKQKPLDLAPLAYDGRSKWANTVYICEG